MGMSAVKKKLVSSGDDMTITIMNSKHPWSPVQDILQIKLARIPAQMRR